VSAVDTPEFSGPKGRFFAWFLTSPLRRVLEWRMGKPEERLMALLALEGHEEVLDAGCGSGFHTLMIAEKLTTGRVVGTDVSVEMLDRLGRLAAKQGLSDRIEPRLADNLALDLPDASFDRALSAAAWHHLADTQQAGDELARVLRPGGRVVVVDLAIAPSEEAVPALGGHDRTFESADLERIFATSGLTNVHVERVGRWLVGVATKPTQEDAS